MLTLAANANLSSKRQSFAIAYIPDQITDGGRPGHAF